MAIAGQPSGWAGVGPSNALSNQARVPGEKAASGSIPPAYRCTSRRTNVRRVGSRQCLRRSTSPTIRRRASCSRSDPFALLIGFAIDQQVPVQKAFAGPLVLKQRVGTLDPRTLATLDLEGPFREKPAIHRFPGAMAGRVRELAAVVAEDYGGDAARIWSEATDAADLRKRLGALPGFGPMKVAALGSVLALQFGVATAAPLVPTTPCLGAIGSPQALADYQAAKRAHKAALRTAAAAS